MIGNASRWGWALGLASVLLVLAAVVSDWPSSLLTGFWAEHAMLTNVVSSLVFVVLGATLVQGWLTRRENRRYEVIEVTAFGGVARAPLAARRGMWFLVNGALARDDEDFAITEQEQAKVTAPGRLNDLAAVMEDVREVRSALSPLRHGEATLTAERREQILVVWRRAFVNASIVQEDFRLSVYTSAYRRRSPALMQPDDREELEYQGIRNDRKSPRTGRVYRDDVVPKIRSAGDEAPTLSAPGG